jgi:hypothetical protein
MKNRNVFKIALNGLIKILIDYQEELAQNPKLILTIIKQYNNVFESSVFHLNKNFHLDGINPVIYLTKIRKKVNQRYLSLINGAYSLNYTLEDLDKRCIQFEMKQYKKFNDYVSFWMKKTKGGSYLKTREDVLNNLFCVVGNGKCWTKEGFIDSEIDNEDEEIIEQSVFFKEISNTVSKEIATEIKHVINKEILVYIKDYKKNKIKEQRLEEQEHQKHHKNLDRIKEIMGEFQVNIDHEKKQNFIFYEMNSQYSLLSNFQSNTHRTYLEAMSEVCLLILSNKRESVNNKQIAQKALTKINRII